MKTGEAVRKRIRELMGERGMFAYQLIKRSGAPASTVKSVLSGRARNPRTDTVTAICAGLEVTVREFYSSELFEDWGMAEEDEETWEIKI